MMKGGADMPARSKEYYRYITDYSNKHYIVVNALVARRGNEKEMEVYNKLMRFKEQGGNVSVLIRELLAEHFKDEK